MINPPSNIPSNIPIPVAPKNPVRFSIEGIVDKIPDLKKYVDTLECDPDLKTFIQSELDEMTSNAAEIHMHDVERPGGGFNLHLTISPVHLGAKPAVS